jgi:predicted dehydrogenase
MSGSNWSRRDVLRGTGMAVAAGAVAPIAGALEHPMLRGKPASANDKIVVGLIGCAGMGSANIQSLMRFDDVEIAALCDVDSNRIPGDYKRIQDKYGKEPAVFADYRKLLERKDIDVVVIATPDHWHALNLIEACEAGKDSLCEKPISHNIVEAVSMTGAARRYKRVVQVNTWQRSGREFTDAIEFVRQGKIGKVKHCRAWVTDWFRAGKVAPSAPPAGLDYDFWTGPAAMIPYRPNHVHFNWRWFMNYGGGLTTDWGVHMMDIALLGMSKGQDLPMPTEVTAYGGRWAFPDDDRDAPDTTVALYRFADPEFVMEWNVCRDTPGKPGQGAEWIGSNGQTVRAWRGGWTVLDNEGKAMPKESLGDAADHARDFLDCVKSRKMPRADLASVAQSTIVCHLANVALEAGETVTWDKARMDLVGKAGRDRLPYARPYRRPWKLPRYRWSG